MDLADRLAEAAGELAERAQQDGFLPDETLSLAQAAEALTRAAVAAAGHAEGLPRQRGGTLTILVEDLEAIARGRSLEHIPPGRVASTVVAWAREAAV
jgi:hypothetical protein